MKILKHTHDTMYYELLPNKLYPTVVWCYFVTILLCINFILFMIYRWNEGLKIMGWNWSLSHLWCHHCRYSCDGPHEYNPSLEPYSWSICTWIRKSLLKLPYDTIMMAGKWWYELELKHLKTPRIKTFGQVCSG